MPAHSPALYKALYDGCDGRAGRQVGGHVASPRVANTCRCCLQPYFPLQRTLIYICACCSVIASLRLLPLPRKQRITSIAAAISASRRGIFSLLRQKAPALTRISSAAGALRSYSSMHRRSLFCHCCWRVAEPPGGAGGARKGGEQRGCTTCCRFLFAGLLVLRRLLTACAFSISYPISAAPSPSPLPVNFCIAFSLPEGHRHALRVYPACRGHLLWRTARLEAER